MRLFPWGTITWPPQGENLSPDLWGQQKQVPWDRLVGVVMLRINKKNFKFNESLNTYGTFFSKS